jgi:hypothetical protein
MHSSLQRGQYDPHVAAFGFSVHLSDQAAGELLDRVTLGRHLVLSARLGWLNLVDKRLPDVLRYSRQAKDLSNSNTFFFVGPVNDREDHVFAADHVSDLDRVFAGLSDHSR